MVNTLYRACTKSWICTQLVVIAVYQLFVLQFHPLQTCHAVVNWQESVNLVVE